MKKTAILFGLLLCLIAPAIQAYESLTIMFGVGQNDEVAIIDISEGYDGAFYEEATDNSFKYTLYDSRGREIISGGFYINPDAWLEGGEDGVSSAIAGANSSDIKEFVVINPEGEEIYRADIEKLRCNNNGVCDRLESYYSCEADCGKTAKDGYCVNDLDGLCDPDCGDQDLDCICPNDICDAYEQRHPDICPSDCADFFREQDAAKTKVPVWLGITITALLVIIAGVLWFVLFKKD